MAIVSAIVLARNDRTGDNPLRVDVTAQQFAWTFKYPDQNDLTSTVLRLPIDRPARFTLRALDVLHSFWVPEFSQKQDAVPGTTTKVTITPNKLGTFPIICTELCGLGHAVMRSTVIVMSKAEFEKWAKQGSQAGGGGGGRRRRRRGGQGGLRQQRVRRVPHAEGRGEAREGRARSR